MMGLYDSILEPLFQNKDEEMNPFIRRLKEMRVPSSQFCLKLVSGSTRVTKVKSVLSGEKYCTLEIQVHRSFSQ